LKIFEKVMYPILIIFLILAIFYSKTNLAYFESAMVAEDGFFQWTIFYTLLFASIMGFYRASILRPFRGTVFSVSLILSGIIFLGFALDEISWCQRIFKFASPLFFLKNNTKMQFNIHHLIINGFHLNNIIFTFGIKIIATLYFLVLPLLYPKHEKLKKFINRFAIPVPRYIHTAAYVILAGFVSLIPSDLRFVIFEFGFYWILVLMMYNPLNDEVFSRISLNR